MTERNGQKRGTFVAFPPRIADLPLTSPLPHRAPLRSPFYSAGITARPCQPAAFPCNRPSAQRRRSACPRGPAFLPCNCASRCGRLSRECRTSRTPWTFRRAQPRGYPFDPLRRLPHLSPARAPFDPANASGWNRPSRCPQCATPRTAEWNHSNAGVPPATANGRLDPKPKLLCNKGFRQSSRRCYRFTVYGDLARRSTVRLGRAQWAGGGNPKSEIHNPEWSR